MTGAGGVSSGNEGGTPPGNDFFDRVWKVVDRIPRGRVSTYGDIAQYLGLKSSARTVGWALKAAAGAGLPCHRVVNRFGALSGRIHFGGAHIMEDLLRSEGIEFDGEGCVLMDRYRWRPADHLPPEPGELDES